MLKFGGSVGEKINVKIFSGSCWARFLIIRHETDRFSDCSATKRSRVPTNRLLTSVSQEPSELNLSS